MDSRAADATGALMMWWCYVKGTQGGRRRAINLSTMLKGLCRQRGLNTVTNYARNQSPSWRPFKRVVTCEGRNVAAERRSHGCEGISIFLIPEIKKKQTKKPPTTSSRRDGCHEVKRVLHLPPVWFSCRQPDDDECEGLRRFKKQLKSAFLLNVKKIFSNFKRFHELVCNKQIRVQSHQKMDNLLAKETWEDLSSSVAQQQGNNRFYQPRWSKQQSVTYSTTIGGENSGWMFTTSPSFNTPVSISQHPSPTVCRQKQKTKTQCEELIVFLDSTAPFGRKWDWQQSNF